MSTFHAIPAIENTNGYRATNGPWTVEVVRCYPGEWAVFVSRHGATQRTINLPLVEGERSNIRDLNDGVTPNDFQRAMRLGRRVLRSLPVEAPVPTDCAYHGSCDGIHV